jgi:RsiW-degrading membrane proteinase PrsW (M82 family)
MKRTHLSTIVAFTLGGLVIGYLADLAIVSAGTKALVPPISLAVTLVGVAVIVVALALPIRRAAKGKATKHLDPFRAMRIAVLAKACSLSGALVLGVGLGITLFLITRSVVPPASTIWQALATAIGAGLLLAGGLVAEWCCTLPPDDTDTEKEEHAHA